MLFFKIVLLLISTAAHAAFFCEVGYQQGMGNQSADVKYYYSEYSNYTRENVLIPLNGSGGEFRIGFKPANFGFQLSNIYSVTGDMSGETQNYYSETLSVVGTYDYSGYKAEAFYDFDLNAIVLRAGAGIGYYKLQYRYTHHAPSNNSDYGRVKASGSDFGYSGFIQGRYKFWKSLSLVAEIGFISLTIKKVIYDDNVAIGRDDENRFGYVTNPAGSTVFDEYGNPISPALSHPYGAILLSLEI